MILIAKGLPSHGDIFEYWKTKIITDTCEIVDYIQYPKINGLDIVKDYGEPECWCCQSFIPEIYNHVEYDNDLQTNCKHIWNYKEVKSKLNRCHIIPKALGGKDEVSNLFLMCEHCHIYAPDYLEPEYFFAYVLSNRKKYVNGFNIGESINNILEVSQMLHKDIKKFDSNCLKNIAHKMSSHGGAMSPWTEIALICDSMNL